MDQREKEKEPGATLQETPGGVEPLEFDPDGYLPMVQEFDGTDEQKAELLTALWNIMSTFVDLGLGADSVQNLFPEMFGKASRGSDDQVDYSYKDEPVNEAQALGERLRRASAESEGE